MAEIKESKVGSAVSIDTEDFEHRLIRVEGEMLEMRRRCIIYERRLLAWETVGSPLRVGEASSRQPTLDVIRKELDRSVVERHTDITELRRRVLALELAVAGVTEGSIQGRDGMAVTEGDAPGRHGPMTGAERARRYRERLRREANRREEEAADDDDGFDQNAPEGEGGPADPGPTG